MGEKTLGFDLSLSEEMLGVGHPRDPSCPLWSHTDPLQSILEL